MFLKYDPLPDQVEWHGVDKETEDSKTPFIARGFASISSLSILPDLDPKDGAIVRGDTPMSVTCFAAPSDQ